MFIWILFVLNSDAAKLTPTTVMAGNDGSNCSSCLLTFTILAHITSALTQLKLGGLNTNKREKSNNMKFALSCFILEEGKSWTVGSTGNSTGSV